MGLHFSIRLREAGANVTLTGFSHTFPNDVSALLVGPTGANVLLMDSPDSGNDVSNLTFTFDDAATSSLPCAVAPARQSPCRVGHPVPPTPRSA